MTLQLKRKRQAQQVSSSSKKQLIAEPGDDNREWGGFGDEAEDDKEDEDEEDVQKMKLDEEDTPKTHGRHSSKLPPTGEELRIIKDASDLFRSNSFKLQIDALLPNIRPKLSRAPPLDKFLLSLHTFLLSIPPVSSQHPLLAARRLTSQGGVAVPYPHPPPPEDTNWTVSFEKPSNVNVVGSWANKIGVKGKDGVPFTVDVTVEMPGNLFQEKDYMNNRYFHKRAFYLATVAAALQNQASPTNLKSKSKSKAIEPLNIEIFYSGSSDPHLTTLLLRPKDDGSATDFTKLNAQVRLIPVLPASSPIPLHRLSPSHSNLRLASNTTETGTTVAPDPTPLYNTAFLLSATPLPHLLTTHALQGSTPAFGDALGLLRVWANQRGYGEGSASSLRVRGFENKGSFWAGILALLILGEENVGGLKGKGKGRKPIGKGVSSYQMFRAAVDFLAKQDWEHSPVFVKSKNGHRFPPDEYVAHHSGAIFVDSTSTINLLAGVPLGSLDLLKHDAKKTLEILSSSSASGSRDPFEEVWLKDQRALPARFDSVLRVDLSTAQALTPNLHSTLDYSSQANALLSSLSSILHRGLGNRIKAVAILHSPSAPRPIAHAKPFAPSSIIHIGLIHDTEHASRLVDHGPAADDPDPNHALEFRQFWGDDKAELRRFKDGRIVESVVWDVKTSDERAHIPNMVVKHLLKRHFGLDSKTHGVVRDWQAEFDAVVRMPESAARLLQSNSDTGFTGFKGAMGAFDQLVKDLKSLNNDIPLSLVNVSPTSEYLRYTSVFSPMPLKVSFAAALHPSLRYLPTLDVVLEFEKSTMWPDDIRAIQKIKLAFFERMASALMIARPGLQARVVVGDTGIRSESDMKDLARLEIVTTAGWAFSARIWHDREGMLLDRIISDRPRIIANGIPQNADGGKVKEKYEAMQLKNLYSQDFIHAPRHHRAITNLCHRYTAYAGTVRLVKRWLASHWVLDDHIRSQAIEIICAAVYLGTNKLPWVVDSASIPGTKERGFAAVIEFLKDWKWEEGLSVPLYTGNEQQRTEPIETSKSSTSFSGKEGVWAISTEQDPAGHMWTSDGPDILVAHRVRALARATSDYLQEVQTGRLDVKGLLVHPTSDYDFVIELDKAVLPRYFQSIGANHEVWLSNKKYANPLTQTEEFIFRPGFDPAWLVFSDLQRVYKESIRFFYDPFGGYRIGAVWDPSVKEPRPFRVLGRFNSTPCYDSKEATKKAIVSANEKAILSEIRRFGLGIIKDIVCNRDQ